jgi:hypothetical protein
MPHTAALAAGNGVFSSPQFMQAVPLQMVQDGEYAAAQKTHSRLAAVEHSFAWYWNDAHDVHAAWDRCGIRHLWLVLTPTSKRGHGISRCFRSHVRYWES